MEGAEMLPFFIPKHSNSLQIGKSTNFPRTIHEQLFLLCISPDFWDAVDIDRISKTKSYENKRNGWSGTQCS